MVLNIGQAFKMAWRSICGKKGRSALTILSIFIGIAAVMTIVSTMEGMKAKTMEQFAAMGANRIEVSVYAYTYDEDGNPISKDYFTGLYRFCSGLKESIIGITPKGSSNATVVYGTKNSSTMEWKYDQQYNVVSGQRLQQPGNRKGQRPCVAGLREIQSDLRAGRAGGAGLFRQRQPCGTDHEGQRQQL